MLRGQADITPAMAVKLSAVLGRSAESWVYMQAAQSLAKAAKEVGATN